MSERMERAGLAGAAEVFLVALRLGLASFGGPIAHLGYFRAEYVERRKWLDEQGYADLVALCQFLPGPASSQVGISVGIHRAGLAGGIAAWAGFTLPSAVALTLFAYLVKGFNLVGAGWLHGLLIVAVAVVAQAVMGMARSFAADRARGALAVLAMIGTLLLPGALTQIVVIALGALAGALFVRLPAEQPQGALSVPIKPAVAVASLSLLGLLLVALPLLRAALQSHAIALFDSFFRVGSLVFGGGHVVLPLLQREVVPPGWVSNAQFLSGYGLAQAVPGPLFTFAAYLGAASAEGPNGWLGAAIALIAIFLPSFLLVVGALPFWNLIRSKRGFRSALAGVNAAVVGLLAAALYSPVWTSAIKRPSDLALAVLAFGLLVAWKLPPWVVVLVSAAGGSLLALLPL